MALNIHQRIKRKRRLAGLTQQALGEMVGVVGSRIAQFEKDQTPNEQQLDKIEDIVGPIRYQKRSAVAGPAIHKNTRAARAKSAEDVAEDEVEVEASPFGIWLKGAREAAGLTSSQLAKQAGVSYQTILNIESGRIANPQQKTVDGIEKVLKSRNASKELLAEGRSIIQDERDENTVEGIGVLTDFEPHDKASWPTCPGVYVFYDISERPIYVGKASNIKSRLVDHEQKFWYRRPIVQFASYINIEDSNLRHQLERVMIKFLKSNAVINKQSTEKFELE